MTTTAEALCYALFTAPGTATDLASRCKMTPAKAKTALDKLVNDGYVTKSDDGVYVVVPL